MADESPIKFHPDADAGLSRLIPIFAAVALARSKGSAMLASMMGGPRPSFVLSGHHSPDISLDLVGPVAAIEHFTASELMLSVRPLFNATIITAYSALQGKAKITNFDLRPTIQFFRHIRNGAAHNNTMVVGKDDLKVPAQWRGVNITASMHDQPVLYKILNAGDVVHLINDAFWETIPE